MPYIKETDRDVIGPLNYQQIFGVDTPGELNYTITKIIHEWIRKKRKMVQLVS